MADTIEITLRDGTAYLGTVADPELLEKIVEGTSFKPAGIEYTTAYKRGRQRGGDGRVKLVKHSKCPAGLVPRVTNIIKDFGADVRLVQADSLSGKAADIETWLDGIESRFYQDDVVAIASLFDRGVVRVPTGGGKSAIAARIIHTRKKAALVIVPTVDLLHQTRNFLNEHLRVLDGTRTEYVVPGDKKSGVLGPVQQFEDIGQLGDKVMDPRRVTVATIRTIAKILNVAYESYEYAEFDDKEEDIEFNSRELREWVESLGVVVVDEAHLLGAKTLFEVTNAIPAKCKIGMSASPWRDDGADLMIEAATGPVLFRISPSILVEHGYLVPPIIRVVSTAKWWTPAAWGRVCKRCSRQVLGYKPTCVCGCKDFKSQFQECYKKEIVENEIRNARIAEQVIALDCPTLVLVKQIKHGQILQQLIPGSVFLSGKEKGKDREQVFDQMRNGELRVIVATTIADMGMDLPILGALVLAGGGKSSTRHLQRLGRVVRCYPGKDCGLVIDFDDGHIHSWFRKHEEARRAIEKAEWDGVAIWC